MNVPELVKQRRLVAVDYICDAGRSVPENCPKTSADHANWVRDIFKALNVEKADFVGYSYGAFVSSVVALEAPELIASRVILTAPAAVVSPITPGFFVHVLASALGKHIPMLGADFKWFWQWCVPDNRPFSGPLSVVCLLG